MYIHTYLPVLSKSCDHYTNQNIFAIFIELDMPIAHEAKLRKYQGVFKAKSHVKTWQV